MLRARLAVGLGHDTSNDFHLPSLLQKDAQLSLHHGEDGILCSSFPVQSGKALGQVYILDLGLELAPTAILTLRYKTSASPPVLSLQKQR